jgi:maleate isomerase
MESALPQQPEGTLDLLARLDEGSSRTVRVGVLLPWANVAVETELPRLGLTHSVFHHARLVPESRTTAVDDAFWNGLREAAAGALDSLTHVPLDAVVLACTSAGFTGGPEMPPGVVTAFDALASALTAARLRRVVLAAPYPSPVTAAESDALVKAGIDVLAHTSLGLDDGYPAVSAEEVLALIGTLPEGAVQATDAVVLSCTGWHTLPVVQDVEQATGKPVITSNLAIGLLAARLSAGATL